MRKTSAICCQFLQKKNFFSFFLLSLFVPLNGIQQLEDTCDTCYQFILPAFCTLWAQFLCGTALPTWQFCLGTLAITLAGKVGCWRVETRVKTTDMCLSGQRVADMSAKMLATRHKKLSAGVLDQHVTACHLLTCWQHVGNMLALVASIFAMRPSLGTASLA
jgi:hypothetical protein